MKSNIGETIWKQITINSKLILRAREPVVGDNSITFTVGGSRGGFTKVMITLNSSDTYDLKLIKFYKKDWKLETIAEQKDIFVEQLNNVLELWSNKI